MNKAKVLTMATVGLGATGAAFAAPILSNDSFDFLSGLGTNLGAFITNLVPGIITLIVVLGIIGAVVAVVYAVAHLISKSFGSHRK